MLALVTRFSVDLGGGWFDRVWRDAALKRARRRVLKVFGLWIRTDIQESMLGHPVPKGFGAKSKVTNRTAIAPPGHAPAPHIGLLVKNIRSEFDETTESEVVGPILLPGMRGAAPRTLEYSGVSVRHSRLGDVTAFIREHPSARPALHRELPKLPQLWKDSIY